MQRLTIPFLGLILLLAAPVSPPPDDTATPALSDAQQEWVDDVVEDLPLEEKVAQLFSIWVSGFYQSVDDPMFERMVELTEDFGLGGIIFGRGEPITQAVLANALQDHADLPLLVAQDMEWGAGMRLDDATVMPRAMAVGATRDAELARITGYITAREARALGVHHIYAPVADVNNNPDNPIINVRSFGENPQLVGDMSSRFIEGAQRGGVLATSKHFPGHGDTDVDSHLDLPVLPFDRARLDSLELVPFQQNLESGVMSVMTGHLAFPALEPEETLPASLSPRVTRDILRDEMNYDGLIVTDALSMDGVSNYYPPGEAAVRALEAGTDILLMSDDPHTAHNAVMEAIETGRLSEERIDESLHRILRAKAWLNIEDGSHVDVDAVREEVAIRPYDVASRHIARKSVTLLENQNDLLPLTPPDGPDVVSVSLENDLEPSATTFNSVLQGGLPPAGSLETIQLHRSAPEHDVERAVSAANDADVTVISTFLQVQAWSGEIGLPERHQEIVDQLMALDTPVVLLSFGNPYLAGSLPETPAASLVVYSDDDNSQRAAAQAITGQSGTSAQLPVSIPGAYSFGDGLTREQVAPRRDHPESIGMDGYALRDVPSLIRHAIEDRAFPGAATAVGRASVTPHLEGHGYHTYGHHQRVTPDTPFDIASLTKVLVTTTATFQLYEDDRLDLDDAVHTYLPDFGQHDKEGVTIRHLLEHSAGLAPWLRPDDRGATRNDIIEAIYDQQLDFEPGTDTQYSDLTMITLGLVIEEITGLGLDEYANQHIFEPLGMHNTGYRGVQEADTTIAPTLGGEEPIRGIVHDPLARQLGGVSGNAGVFSTASDLSRFAHMLVNDGAIYGRQFLEPSTIELMRERVDVEGSTRALGWDTKTTNGYTSAGDSFGPHSFGHTGFTGTSLWIDPDEQLFTILLSNRVYPDEGGAEAISQLRPRFGNVIHNAILGPPEPILPLN